jgi:integrase
MPTGRLVEEIKGKKYKIIIEAGKDPSTGKRRRIVRRVSGRKPDAEREMANIIRDLEQGTYIEPSSTTLAEYLRYWLENYAQTNLAPSTYSSYDRIINTHIIEALGHVPLMKLTPLQIQAYYTDKLKDGRRDGQGGLSHRTVRYHHTILREALQHALKWRMLVVNPADATEPPVSVKAEIYPLSEEELDILFQTAEGHRDKWLIMFAAYSGLREGEMLALKWSAVDLECKTPSLRVQQTVGYINGQGFVYRPVGKSKKARREIVLTDIAIHALKQQKKMQAAERLAAPPKEPYEDNGLVFATDKGKPMDPSGLGRRFKRLAVKAGFREARLHDLRHSFATLLLAKGVHPKIVQEILGHETIGVTMDTYSHVIKGIQEEAIQRLNDHSNNRKWHQNGTKTQKSRP